MAIPLPDRFRKKPLMTPPGKKGVTVAIGISKPKPGDDDALKPGADPMADDDAPAMSPAGAGGAPRAEPDADDQGDGEKVSPEDAIVLRGDDKTCQQCENWNPQDGSCSKVNGMFDASDRCLRFYSSASDGGDQDSDDSGTASSLDSQAPPVATPS